MMPFMDGMTCLREMRARHINTPVIILNRRGEEYDKLAGLEGGARTTMWSSPSPGEAGGRGTRGAEPHHAPPTEARR